MLMPVAYVTSMEINLANYATTYQLIRTVDKLVVRLAANYSMLTLQSSCVSVRSYLHSTYTAITKRALAAMSASN